jgi:predicted N-acetyltransferase YhbS
MGERAVAHVHVSRPRLTAITGGHAVPTVRPLRREDLPEVAAMFAETMHATPPDGEDRLAEFFRRTLIDHPWADPELPSFVAEQRGGGIVGLVGVQARRLRFRDRDLRLACIGFFAVHPGARPGAVALQLARDVMGGAQDASVGDSASMVVERFFAPRHGGRVVELSGGHWVRAWRPGAVADGLVPAVTERLRGCGPLHVLGRGIDRGAARASRRILAPERTDSVAQPLTPALLLKHQPSILPPGSLHVAYDEPYLTWLFTEMGCSPARGLPIAHLVRDSGGRALGWYVYYLRPGGRSEVMQIVARPRDHGAVLDHLLRHAWEHGSAMLRGRLEPGLTALVCRRRCMLWYRGGALAHSHDPELADALVHHGTLSRLDNEWFSDSLI